MTTLPSLVLPVTAHPPIHPTTALLDLAFMEHAADPPVAHAITAQLVLALPSTDDELHAITALLTVVDEIPAAPAAIQTFLLPPVITVLDVAIRAVLLVVPLIPPLLLPSETLYDPVAVIVVPLVEY